MFMPKAALAHLMAAIRQDVTRADADRLRVHNIYLFTSVCYRIVLKKMGAEHPPAPDYICELRTLLRPTLCAGITNISVLRLTPRDNPIAIALKGEAYTT